jgi:hypothetical protein
LALVVLFLFRFFVFASPRFSSISELVVVVGDPEHDRLGRPVFQVSASTHLFSPLTPMIGVIGQQRGTGGKRRRAKKGAAISPFSGRSWLS